jgi:hypothetical protein
MEPWFSQMKSDRVGELPEATNESLCEDIMPPSGEDALEGRTKVGFAPYRPYPFFRKVSTVAFSARLLER